MASRYETPVDMECPWEWVSHLTLPYSCSGSTAQRLLKKWRLSLGKRLSLTLGLDPLFVAKPNAHLHVLLVGRNRDGKTLLDHDTSAASEEWEWLTHLSGETKEVFSPDVRSYLQGTNNMRLSRASHKGQSFMSRSFEQLPIYWPEQLKRMPNLSSAIKDQFIQATDNSINS